MKYDKDKRIIKIEELCQYILQKIELLKGLDSLLPNSSELQNINLEPSYIEKIKVLALARDSVWDSLYLTLGRLVVDKEETEVYKKTISLKQFIEEYKSKNYNKCEEIKGVLEKHKNTISKIKNKRNKIIAHYDLSIANSHSEEEFNNKNEISNSEITEIIKDLMHVFQFEKFELLSSQGIINNLKNI